MAFDFNTLSQIGGTAASPIWSTYLTDDTKSQVLAAGYFNNAFTTLRKEDYVLVNASDASFTIKVTATGKKSVTVVDEEISKSGASSDNEVPINKLSDFPAPVGGVITLADSKFYLVGVNLPVSPDRWVLGQDTILAGLDSSASSMSYSGTGTMFTSVDNSNKITLLTLDCPNGKLHDISATGPGAVFQLINCTVDNVKEIGNMSDLTAIQYSDVAFNNIITTGITFVGSIGIFIGATDLVTVNGATPFFDLGTATFDSFDISASLATLGAGASFISGLTGSGNITSGNTGSLRGVKTFGTGTPLVGITIDDVRWFFSGNDDIPSTNPDALLSLNSNATATVIDTANTPVLIAGTWVIEDTSFFTATTAGRLTYVGERPISVPIDIVTTTEAVSGTNKDITTYLALNGTIIANSGKTNRVGSSDPKNTSVPWQLTFVKDDFVESFIENNTDTVNLLTSSAVCRIN